MMELLTLTVCNWVFVMSCKFSYICACFIYYGDFFLFHELVTSITAGFVSLVMLWVCKWPQPFARLFVLREPDTLLIKFSFLVIRMVVGMKAFKCH
jgi:hypothetical protein